MEVLQHTREEMEVKIPLINHYTEEEEDVEETEEALVGLRARRSKTVANGTTSDEKDGGFSSHICENSDKSEVEECVNEDGSNKCVYFDNHEEVTMERSDVGKNLEDKDFTTTVAADIQNVLSAVINGKAGADLKDEMSLPLSTKPMEEDRTSSRGETRRGTENLQVDIVDEIDEEVIELEFERAVEKMHTHEYEMYCPNCSNRITKVVLRRRKLVKKVPASSEAQRPNKPVDLFGCLSCFSIFAAGGTGNKLNPFRIFGRDKASESSPLPQQQQTSDTLFSMSHAGSSVQQQDASDMTSSAISSTQINGKGFDKFSIFGKSQLKGNDLNVQPSSVPASNSSHLKANDRTTKQDGAIGVSKHPITPGSEIKEELNIIANQQEGGGVQVRIGEESVQTETSQFTEGTVIVDVPGIATKVPSSRSLEIMKAIVYGGLMESIASLGVVSSAAASGVTTLKIVALGLANLISGLVILGHNLRDLKNGEFSQSNEAAKRYNELLGRRENFLLHAVVAVLSYLVFGIVPPVTFGFTFRESDDGDYKLLAVAAASLLCIIILAISKAYTRGKDTFLAYFKTVVYYVICAVLVSGIAYAVGDVAKKLLGRSGWWDSSPVQAILIPETKSIHKAFASF